MERYPVYAETNRLVIRSLMVTDYHAWLKGFNDRMPSQHKYDDGRIDMEDCTEEWFSRLVDKYEHLAKSDSDYVLDLFLKEDGRHVGTIDFSTLAREGFQWGRIGYTIHNQFWGRGYGKEAVKETLSIAFTKLDYHRIEAHINVDNIPSERLAKSVGMEFECVRKGFIFEFEKWTDNLVYYLNRK
ncbi:GNAT family N-acetyltransferase [Bacillus sp. B-jedd]|uniref:GNAT family N-acetyltransferase n=1 Tax=Bacillus sp. B-jedd TaxID=1476857 RepID=UPI0005156956|nr:GNAT family N-acetyltransferase [Bacillus sp. B-jedd]CEG29470.1 N-acetyltransferase GCN5 [Bacillus sp. B-jedd]